MAKNKEKNEAVEGVSAEDFVFDMANLGLPSELGIEPKDLVDIGGMRPIAAAEVSFESKSAVAGWLIGEQEMPPRASIDPAKRSRGEKDDWSALVVLLTTPTMAYVGDEVVEVPAGKQVIIPVGGNLANNYELLQKAHDPRQVFWVALAVAGQVRLDKQRNPMWSYAVKSSPKGKDRDTGVFALPRPRNLPRLSMAQTIPGQVIDKNGQPARLVG